MIFIKYIFQVLNKVCLALCIMPIMSLMLGFALLPIYRKQPSQITWFESTLVGSNEVSYPLLENNNYIDFSIYLMQKIIPAAIGAGIAVSGADIFRKRNKSMNDVDKFK